MAYVSKDHFWSVRGSHGEDGDSGGVGAPRWSETSCCSLTIPRRDDSPGTPVCGHVSRGNVGSICVSKEAGPREALKLALSMDDENLKYKQTTNNPLPVPSSIPTPPPQTPQQLPYIHPLPSTSDPLPPFPSSHQPLPDGYFTSNDFGMDMNFSVGLLRRNAASESKTLRPFNPSSPPRKKARGGNKRRFAEKVILDLEEDNWARFFIIKKKEGSFLNYCSFKMNKALKSLVGQSKSRRKLGDGTICIEAETKAQAEAILSIKSFCDSEVDVVPHKKMNSSQGVITCRDFLNSSLEDIKDGLADEGVIEVRRIKRKQGDSLVDTASLVLTFNRPKPPSSIEAAFYKLKVRPYVPSPMRCYRCHKFGHTSQRCKAPEQLCACGKLTHEGECTPPITCVNCGGEHTARSTTCPTLHEEKEIQKIKTIQQLPYHEARAIVKSKSYIKTDISFAKATATKQLEGKPFTFTATSGKAPELAKPGPSPALRGNISKVRESPQSNITAPTGAPVALRSPKTPPAPSGGKSKSRPASPETARPTSPKTSLPSGGEWRVAKPQRRSPRREERPQTSRRGVENIKPAGDQRITRSYYVRRSPRPKWEVLGTDLDASESEGGGASERPSTRKKRGKTIGVTKKQFTD